MSVASLLGSGSIVGAVVGIDESLKQCTKCGEWKERSEFYKDKQKKDGLRPDCNLCHSAYNVAYKNREKPKLDRKQCTRCKKIKTVDNFYPSDYNPSGYSSHCKDCRKIYEMTLQFREKIEIEEKQCSRCEEIKPIDDFGRNKNKTDGREAQCKECKKVKDTIYRKTPQGKAANKKAKYKRRLLSSDLPTDNLTNQLLHKRFRLINVMLFDHCCPYCGKYLEYDEAHLDHFIPVSNFGTNEIENIIHCCLSCNTAKLNKSPWKWLRVKYIEDRGIPFDPKFWQDITSPEWEELVYKWAKSSNDSVVA